MTYRTRYYTTLHPVAVLDVLMADGTNPRSLDFQVEHLAELYEKLPRHLPGDLATIQNAVARLRSIDLSAIRYPSVQAAPGGSRNKVGDEPAELAPLDQFLGDLQGLLPVWSNHLSNLYFSHVRTQQITVGEQ
jgi:hypothetical protein